MTFHATHRRPTAIVLILGAAAVVAGCGSKEPTAQAPATPAPTATSAPATAPGSEVPTAATPAPTTWTAEALEELLAPIALYPDPVLSQVLIASTNPQEVLDAGNWLLQNQSLKGKALDDAAAQVGFTPPIRALLQFPETVDMMCLQLGWTTELGQAFTADQAGVLDAIQRLRVQARDVGNLQSSEQMKVETEVQEGKEVVVLKPAQPEVVYVPQYDPVAVYAPPPATTTTTTAASGEKGYSTGAMVTTGLLAFGAGILVSELFDDDDDRYDYYYPNYGYGGMPYYPPYPYRPSYGGGYYPSNGYHRPPNYNSGFQNTGTIIINNGGNQQGGGYWDRYDSNRPRGSGGYAQPRTVSSPITAARPSRPEMNELNKRQPRAMPADVKPPSATATAANWKGQSGYAGAKPGAKKDAQARIASATPGYSKPPAAKPGSRDVQKAPPKVQGSYASAKPGAATRDVPRPAPATRDAQGPSKGQGDRGYSQPTATKRPAPSTAGGSVNRSSAVSGAQRGGADRAASQRGKQSMPQGARSKGSGGGASGGGANAAKQRAR